MLELRQCDADARKLQAKGGEELRLRDSPCAAEAELMFRAARIEFKSFRGIPHIGQQIDTDLSNRRKFLQSFVQRLPSRRNLFLPSHHNRAALEDML